MHYGDVLCGALAGADAATRVPFPGGECDRARGGDRFPTLSRRARGRQSRRPNAKRPTPGPRLVAVINTSTAPAQPESFLRVIARVAQRCPESTANGR